MATDPDALEEQGNRSFRSLLVIAVAVGVGMAFVSGVPTWLRIGLPVFMLGTAFSARWAMRYSAAELRARQSNPS